MKCIIFLLTLMTSTQIYCKETLDDINFVQVYVFKYSMEKGCVDHRIKIDNDKNITNSFCGCMLKTLNDNITDENWRKIVFSAQYEKKIIQNIPELMVAMPQVKQCSSLLTPENKQLD